jgi:peptidoglycan-N-acetylglucosamine deacetylase
MASTPQPGRTPKGAKSAPVGGPRLRIRWDRVNVLIALAIVLATVIVHSLVGAIRSNPEVAVPPPTAAKPPEARPAATKPPETRPAAKAAANRPAVNTHKTCGPPTSGAIRTAPARHGPAGEAQRTVALTFDDGPGPSTPYVLDVLRQHGVTATFFVVGRNAAATPDMLRRIVAEGHVLGDHTWSHNIPSAKTGWKASTLTREIEQTRQVIVTATGREPCLFRPPGGITKGAHKVVRSVGLSMIIWSVDTRDWAAPPNPKFASVIQKRAAAGLKEEHPVILLHDGGGNQVATVAALAGIINDYRSHGYQFVTLAESR